jgi:hypothetical protein
MQLGVNAFRSLQSSADCLLGAVPPGPPRPWFMTCRARRQFLRATVVGPSGVGSLRRSYDGGFQSVVSGFGGHGPVYARSVVAQALHRWGCGERLARGSEHRWELAARPGAARG